MTVNISNKHIFYAVAGCWSTLHYKLKNQINGLVTADSNLETVQELEINVQDFIQVMRSVNNQAQGVAKEINPELYDLLKAQVLTLAQAGNTEAIEVAQAMASILQENTVTLNNIIQLGKVNILA
jgi:hypothetical protein